MTGLSKVGCRKQGSLHTIAAAHSFYRDLKACNYHCLSTSKVPHQMQLQTIKKKLIRFKDIVHYEVVPCAVLCNSEAVAVDILFTIALVGLIYLLTLAVPISVKVGTNVISALPSIITA